MNPTSIFRRCLVAAIAVFLVFAISFGQTLKNGGSISNTGSITYKEVQNFKGGNNGTINNQGTLATTTAGGGTGDFKNTDGVARAGIVNNYITTNGGTLVVANNLTNNFAGATIDNDGTTGFSTVRIGGTINNTGGTFTTTKGRVDYFGAGAATILATTYGALVTNDGAKTLGAGTTTVNDSLRVDWSSTLTVGANQLDLNGATNAKLNSATFDASGGTVRYAGDRDQTMIPATYKTLTLTGSSAAHSKTSAGTISFAASGSLTVDANDTLHVSAGILDLSTNTPSFTNNSAVRIDGNASFHGGITNAGTFYYAGSAAQIIGAVSYVNLRLGYGGAKTFPAGTVAVTGNYTIDPGLVGARDYTTNSNTFEFAGTVGTQAVTNLSEAFYKLQFSGAALKTLAGTAFSVTQMELLSGTGVVTNNVTTVTLGNIAGTSLVIASGTELVNSAAMTINLNGDLNNDGTLTNAGTIGVY